jgi:hypothetical protein
MHNIFIRINPVPPQYTKMDISSHALSRKHQITVRFAGYTTILGTQCRTGFMSPFWCPEFGGG